MNRNPNRKQLVRIGVAQYAVTGDDTQRNQADVLSRIEELGKSGCNVAALPELCATRYFPIERDERAFELAIRTDDPFVRSAGHLAREHVMDVLLPIFEEAGDGVYYNSVAWLRSDGSLGGVYRKTHVPAVRSFEKYYFRPGSELAPFDAAWGRFGCLLCQDRFFPETSRVLALRGARIIFILNASADYAGFAGTWEPINRTRACENGCFVVAVNRTGTQGEIEFFGNSLVISPDGSIVKAAGKDEGMLVADIDPGEIRKFRNSIQMYRDYRPDLYGDIVGFTDMHDA